MSPHFILLGLMSLASTTVLAKQSVKSELDNQFFGHCESKTLTVDEQHTIDALYKRYKVDSCIDLHARLTDFEYQHITNAELKDVTIFKYVYGLKRLSLDHNLIEDVSGLETLKSLTMLSLRQNKLSDVRPLLKMESLEDIYLYGNPVEKESQYCPTETHLIDINEFCFDEDQFNFDFKRASSAVSYDDETVKNIFNLVINYSGLEIYYHADELESRVPLKIFVDKNISSKSLDLEKFGKPVLISNTQVKIGLNCILTVKGALAVVQFEYPPEGVFGQFKLKKTNHNWTIMKSEFFE